ncbi:MAG: hypothetical protein J6T41_03380, partial [Neisseriaceae bacterium]|nr:hypothetical protein [Neisseriaceae bacterium]
SQIIDMEKLVDYKEEWLWHGCVFRFPAKAPYENFVDFMLTIFSSFSNDKNLYLVVTSGYNAGFIVRQLPPECHDEQHIAVKTKWLIDNWNDYVYSECNVEDVYVIPEHYELKRLSDKSIDCS